ncbi:hypothetical protein PanWU01x14_037680 [Parasponia andersonii]|uniref:Uncharacterized protein n=1 Tax=Parasponia andersonii TaxID=3476 RepID=A0A2P5DS03_PARAD|nr:hypothetical protein PanWU01x14_037680 [Parasponia andersonii]
MASLWRMAAPTAVRLWLKMFQGIVDLVQLVAVPETYRNCVN